jgi:general secretion pathway protein G
MKRAGFTLLELLAVVAVVLLLAAILMPAVARSMDTVHTTRCAANMRQLAAVYTLYAADHEKVLPTKAMLGNSSYRTIHDPLGLPSYFASYISKESVWLCPRGRKTLLANGVNYAWSRAQNLVSESGAAGAYGKPKSTILVWDNFNYALPSVFGVTEATSGGPNAVTTALYYKPHERRGKVNYLYLDGHVELK